MCWNHLPTSSILEGLEQLPNTFIEKFMIFRTGQLDKSTWLCLLFAHPFPHHWLMVWCLIWLDASTSKRLSFQVSCLDILPNTGHSVIVGEQWKKNQKRKIQKNRSTTHQQDGPKSSTKSRARGPNRSSSHHRRKTQSRLQETIWSIQKQTIR